jgi:hypothetical protein
MEEDGVENEWGRRIGKMILIPATSCGRIHWRCKILYTRGGRGVRLSPLLFCFMV